MSKKILVYIKLHYSPSEIFCNFEDIEECEYLFERYGLYPYIRNRKQKTEFSRGYRSTYYIYTLKFTRREKEDILRNIRNCARVAEKDFKILVQ